MLRKPQAHTKLWQELGPCREPGGRRGREAGGLSHHLTPVRAGRPRANRWASLSLSFLSQEVRALPG